MSVSNANPKFHFCSFLADATWKTGGSTKQTSDIEQQPTKLRTTTNPGTAILVAVHTTHIENLTPPCNQGVWLIPVAAIIFPSTISPQGSNSRGEVKTITKTNASLTSVGIIPVVGNSPIISPETAGYSKRSPQPIIT
mmetsp:Transcript_20142/g.34396  ORF Transcript_20142/g.34396 Transcript_20142/m.34396 type:complete len:138 (+) Transcript_20142:478-891(+)